MVIEGLFYDRNGVIVMTDKEALEYFYRQMENGNINNDIMQLDYECAIEALEEKIKMETK